MSYLSRVKQILQEREQRSAEEEEEEESEKDVSAKESKGTMVPTTHVPVSSKDGCHKPKSMKKNKDKQPNVSFYRNDIPCVPHGDFVDNIHVHWYYAYEVLERHHGYIQWLFPTFEGSAINDSSAPLGKDEALFIRNDFECACRVLRSYIMMLNFYGLKLVNMETGEVQRSDNWKERYRNMSILTHNNLRISRILQSLGQLGFARYKKPLFLHFKKEMDSHKQLLNCKNSLIRFWTPLVLGEDTPAYKSKTKETPEDRTDSIFFTHLNNKSAEYQQFLEKERELEQLRKEKQLEEQNKKKRHGTKAATTTTSDRPVPNNKSTKNPKSENNKNSK